MNVSIIITFYNKRDLLLSAIDSVISQKCEDDEIIVVDDCSDDTYSLQSLEKAKDIYEDEVLFYKTDKNRGASYAKDFGIRLAGNEIILLLDADDKFPSNCIQKVKKRFEKDESLDFVYGDYVKNEINGGTEKKEKIDCSIITNSTNNELDKRKLAKNWIMLGTSPFKKETYLNSGGFDPVYPRTDDVDFQKKALLNGSVCGYISEVIYIWNRYPDGNNANIPKHRSLFSSFRNIEFDYKYLNNTSFLIKTARLYLKLIMYKILFFKTN